MGLPLLILQLAAAAAPAPAAQAPPARPDIELRARVRARSLTIETIGTNRLAVRAEPAAAQAVEVEGKLPAGARTGRNLDVRLYAQATIADPQSAEPSTTGEPKP